MLISFFSAIKLIKFEKLIHIAHKIDRFNVYKMIKIENFTYGQRFYTLTPISFIIPFKVINKQKE